MNYAYGSFINQSFEGRDLKDTVFVGANLQGADFTGADVRGSNFSGANLRDITISVSCNMFSEVTFDRRQIMAFLYLLTKTKQTPDMKLQDRELKRVGRAINDAPTIHDILLAMMSLDERRYLATLFGEI